VQVYQFQPPVITIASGVAQMLWQTTFADLDYPTNHDGDPVGRSGVHWETSDYLYNDYGANFNPGIGGIGGNGGIGMAGGWFTSLVSNPADHLWHPTGDDRICTAANNPLGGGKGFRHYRGNGSTGQNKNGGGITLNLPSPLSEFWFRMYMRYQQGFTWGPSSVANPGYTKELRNESPNGWVFGIQGAASWGIQDTVAGAIISSKSWQSTMGGMKGDGIFHCYEFHWQNGPNSHIEMWVDDVKVLDTIKNTSTDLTQNLLLGSNQNAVGDANGLSVVNGGVPTDYFTDYDDIAISTAGRIGPL